MSRPTPGGALLHPVSVGAVALLVLNDHVLKSAWPGVVTGKLSDIAGMVFFPLLLLSAWEWGRSLAGASPVAGRAVVASTVVCTGIAFAAIQLWPPAGEAWAWTLGALQAPLRGSWRPVPHTADPTDLVALPALGVAVWLAEQRRRRWDS